MGVGAVAARREVVQTQVAGAAGAGGPGSGSHAGHGAASLGGGAGASLADAVRQLQQAIAALSSAVGGVAGVAGGGPASGCGCSSTSGGDGAPPPPAPEPHQEHHRQGGADGAPRAASSSPQRLAGETSHSGLQDKARQVLSAAHQMGLRLISGHRPGDDGGHGNGTAVDVANVPGGSRQGSPEMEAFAEAMRAAGKAGDPTIGYVIYQQRIASARDGWAWRPMEDRGSNTANHFDHVHVSTDPGR